MVAEGIADCLRLGPIPTLGGCGVGIQVLDCRGSEPSILQSEFHHPANSSAPLRWRCSVSHSARVQIRETGDCPKLERLLEVQYCEGEISQG
jgi:hypothetical protein